MTGINDRKSQIDIAKFQAWLNSKEAVTACPLCKNDNWLAVNGPNHFGSALPYGVGEAGDYAISGFPVFVIACSNCSYARMFALTKELIEVVRQDVPE